MNSFLNAPGFLGTNATVRTDITLILTLISAALFTYGWRLAVRRRYKTHRKVQTAGVILNTLVVLLVMAVSFVKYILPGIPGKLGEGSYGITTLHALIGLAGMSLGLFVVGQGNGLIFKGVRIRNYKRLMRVTYGIYMLATLSGVIIYIVVFIYGI
jgi:putative membrane protein